MVRAVSVALLTQIGAFLIAGATLALGIDGRIDEKIRRAIEQNVTKADIANNNRDIDSRIEELRSELRMLRMRVCSDGHCRSE